MCIVQQMEKDGFGHPFLLSNHSQKLRLKGNQLRNSRFMRKVNFVQLL
jgi:hypothetical protein